MKVRWTGESVRFRITPCELETLLLGDAVCIELAIPGGAWRASLAPIIDDTEMTMKGSHLKILLSPDSLNQLADPNSEGVYFESAVGDRAAFYIEKDFPCAHKRPGDAYDPPSATFEPTRKFQERQRIK